MPFASRIPPCRESIVSSPARPKGFRLRDSGAQNRIYVNGLPVREDLLRPGDQVKIGRSLFLIALEDEGFDLHSDPILWEQRELRAQSTVVLRFEDSLYTDPARTVASLSSRHVVQHLKVMLKIGEAISTVSGLEMLAQRLMELAAEAIPAQRIALLLFSGNDPREIEHEFHWERPGSHTARGGLPLPLLRKVVEERISVWNRPGDTGNALEGRSELAVPLLVIDRVIGAVTLTRRAKGMPEPASERTPSPFPGGSPEEGRQAGPAILLKAIQFTLTGTRGPEDEPNTTQDQRWQETLPGSFTPPHTKPAGSAATS